MVTYPFITTVGGDQPVELVQVDFLIRDLWKISIRSSGERNIRVTFTSDNQIYRTSAKYISELL